MVIGKTNLELLEEKESVVKPTKKSDITEIGYVLHVDRVDFTKDLIKVTVKESVDIPAGYMGTVVLHDSLRNSGIFLSQINYEPKFYGVPLLEIYNTGSFSCAYVSKTTKLKTGLGSEMTTTTKEGFCTSGAKKIIQGEPVAILMLEQITGAETSEQKKGKQ
jgi:hypothetical protein